MGSEVICNVVWFWGLPDPKKSLTSGKVEVLSDRLTLLDGRERILPFEGIQSIDLSRSKSFTRILVQTGGEELSLMVPRFQIAGLFLVVNYLATRRLYGQIDKAWHAAKASSSGT